MNSKATGSELNMREKNLSDFFRREAGRPSCDCPGELVVIKIEYGDK